MTDVFYAEGSDAVEIKVKDDVVFAADTDAKYIDLGYYGTASEVPP